METSMNSGEVKGPDPDLIWESIIGAGEIEKWLKNSKGRKNLNLRRRGRGLLLAAMRTEIIHLADK